MPTRGAFPVGNLVYYPAMRDPFDVYGLSRRKFLRSSLSGTLMLPLAGLLPAGCAGYPQRSDTLQVLDAKTAAIFDAIADAMVDDGQATLPVPSKLGIAGRLDKMLAGLHPDVAQQSVLLFQAVEHLTFAFGFYGSRFTRLPREAQREYLAGWMNSSLGFRKMAAQALKMFVYVNYYSFPETFAHLGYDGPWVGRFEIPHFEPPLAAYNGDKEPL